MGDFDPPGHRRRTLVLLLTGVVLVVAGMGVWWVAGGRSTDRHGATTAAAPAGSVPPPWPATSTPAAAPGPVGPVDGGQGWTIPNPGAGVGPAAVTDLGVPYGYTRSTDGAALAAVNAVIAGRYLAGTFPDPWAALGFLADPQFAARGGNPPVEVFLTGPPRVQIVDQPAATVTPAPTSTAAAGAAPPAGGGRVVGVRVEDAPNLPDGVRATVLWERFNLETQPDASIGYTVAIEPVSVLLVWSGDWKVSRVSGPPLGMATRVLGTVPVGFPLPAENWHR